MDIGMLMDVVTLVCWFIEKSFGVDMKLSINYTYKSHFVLVGFLLVYILEQLYIIFWHVGYNFVPL